jgi:actin-like ATPase involved in cell morphogenesis
VANIKVGIDAGYGYLKVVTENKQIVLPSVLARMDDAVTDVGLFLAPQPEDTVMVEVNGARYYLGEAAREAGRRPIVPFGEKRVDDAAFGVIWQTGLALAAREAGDGEASLSVVIGLPVEFYDADRPRLLEQMAGAHVVSFLDVAGRKVKEVNYKVAEAHVMPQPIGAFYRTLLDRSENMPPLTMVVDIGAKTTDIAAVTQDRKIRNDMFISWNVGVSSIGESLRKVFQELRHDYNVSRVDKVIRDGGLLAGSQFRSLQDEIKKGAVNLADQIAHDITQLPNVPEVNLIVIAGGGAAVLGNELAAILKPLVNADIVVLEDGQKANAIGFYQLADSAEKTAKRQAAAAGASA